MLRRPERWGEALPFAKDGCERLRQAGHVPLEPENRAVYLCSYGVCLSQLGRHAEAIEPLMLAREALREGGDRDADSLAPVLKCLVDSSRALNRPEEAARWAAALDAVRATTQ